MFVSEVHSDATAGIIEALIAAYAMRTTILLMSELRKQRCCEETYNFAQYVLLDVSHHGSGQRLRHLNLGLEKRE
jgi:hypothetical protein